ncbi:MAG TPA: DUF6797 domain-containing protein [Planctomycetota bacterium]|nr:DUF6797 domain-containing protein [Planctomycetota bacterium]
MKLNSLLTVALCLLAGALSAGEGKRASQMDYGPVMAATYGVKGSNAVTMKGLAIRLSQDPPAYICFDTELLRVSAAWTGEYIDWKGINLEGGMTFPKITGDIHAAASALPGWGPSEELKDPRAHGEGPLPAEYGRFKGHYIHGEHVVLSYTAAGATVLERPSVERAGNTTVFTRAIQLAPTTIPLTLLVADHKGAAGSVKDGIATLTADGKTLSAGLSGAPEGAELKVNGGAIIIKLPPSGKPRLFSVQMARCEPAVLKAALKNTVDNPEALTKGGPARYAQTVETKGEPGSGAGAYVVDTITLPDENPWKSWFRVGGFDFFSGGKRAALCTWNGDVWIVSGIDDSLQKLTWKRFATGLFQPLGLRIVDDRIYVTGRDQITRLHDLNGDGEADFYENFNNDCAITTNFHEFTMDLQTDAAGNFYYAKGQGYYDWPTPEQRQTPHNGTIVRVSKDGSKLDVVATGLRAPNGVGLSPDGKLSCGENNGHWVPSCPFFYAMKEGGYFGFPWTAQRTPVPPEGERPLCWLPPEADNSPGGQVWVTSKNWGPFSGRLLHTSYGKCTLFTVFTQQAGDIVQGGMVPFPLQFPSGIMRARFNDADGQLYLSGMRGWQTSGVKDGGFYRVRYTGKPANMATSLIATQSGIEITFTDALDPASATSAENYAVETFNVRRTKNYGSPEYSVAEPTRKGRDDLFVEAVTLSEDRKKVTLEIPYMSPATNLIVTAKVKTADGQALKQKIYSTVHTLPAPERKAGDVNIAAFKGERFIVGGASATLEWKTVNATSVRIEPGIGKVDASGSMKVSPKQSTGYKLIAEGPGGPVSARVRVEIVTPREPVAVAKVEPGLRVQYFEAKKPNVMPDFKKLKPYATSVIPEINSPPGEGNVATSGRADEVAAVFTGFIKVPADATYTFYLGSDDGSMMWLGNDKVIESNRQQDFEEGSYTVALKAGLHPVRIEYFENGGGAGIVLSWQSFGTPKQVIPGSALFHAPE